MNTYTLSVLRAGIGRSYRPLISFSAPWLPEMGFTPGALVQVLPESGGILFILCDDIPAKYSELLRATEEKKGTLITVDDCCVTGIRIEIDGYCIRNAGLDVGDHLVAQYEYGLIRVRRSGF